MIYMKKIYRAILYLFICLLIIAGVLLFIFHEQILAFLENQTGLATQVTIVKPATSTATSVLDTSVLASPRFTALTDNVINFDFDNICYRPSGAQVVALNPGTDAAASSTDITTINCVQGNSLPFFTKVVK